MTSEIDLTKKLNLIQGDCLEVLKQLPNKSIDLILTDPPYGIGINKMSFVKSGAVKVGGAYRNDYSNSSTDWDIERLKKEQWIEIERVSKNQIIFGANNFSDILPKSQCWYVWDKRGHEKYTNDFSDCEFIWTSFKKPSRVIRYLFSGMIQENMKRKEIRVHPTQKPVPVIEKLIKDFSNSNDLICDCFLGSGSTGVAALKLNRRFLGVELDKDYFEIAKKRISEWEGQSRLF